MGGSGFWRGKGALFCFDIELWSLVFAPSTSPMNLTHACSSPQGKPLEARGKVYGKQGVDRYSQLVSFIEKKGRFNEKLHGPNSTTLGRWVQHQRKAYRYHIARGLSASRRAKLDALDPKLWRSEKDIENLTKAQSSL